MLVNCFTEYGNDRKEHHEDDGDIENQTLHAASCLEDRSRAAATKGTAKSRPTHLQENKADHDEAENDLYDSNCWKPLL